MPYFDRNERIRADELLVIDNNGESLGIISRQRALELANQQELDLVLINPQASPPVAKIVSWSKFKYEQSKKRRGGKAAPEQKEMWFKPFIDEGDMSHKLDRVREFVKKGHKVKLTVRYKRGADPKKMQDTMDNLVAMLQAELTMELPPKHEGRNIAVYVSQKK